MNPFLYLERNAKSAPSGVFVESIDRKILNSEALILVKQVAYELRRIGVKPGDTVALELPELLSILFTEALFHEAAASTVLPKGFESNGAFDVDWVFTSSAAANAKSTSVVVDDAFVRNVERNPYGITHRDFTSPASLLRIVFSSGTTGTPHAIALTLGMLESHSTNALNTWMRGDPFLLFLGTSSAMGFNGFYLSVQDGRPFLVVGTGAPADIARLASNNSVTSLKASPAQLAGLVGALETQGLTLPSVDSAYVVGTVISPELSGRLRRVTGGCDINNLYGSTEATIAFARYYDSDDPYDAGQLFPGSTVQIVDDADQPLPDGQVGRIRHRHPQMVHEYLGDPEATLRSFTDGWFYPGDMGLIRPADGGLTLAGRSSELLNAGGVKLDPTRLDLFATRHEGVVDACSFEYSTRFGAAKIGIALVVDDDFDVQSLVRDLSTEFGSAAPSLVVREDVIPRNAMGKLQRALLAEKYKEG